MRSAQLIDVNYKCWNSTIIFRQQSTPSACKLKEIRHLRLREQKIEVKPFLYPYIGDVIDHLGKNYRNKIVKIIITSNGTITPKDETFNFLRKYKVLVAISDYTDSIDFIGKN